MPFYPCCLAAKRYSYTFRSVCHNASASVPLMRAYEWQVHLRRYFHSVTHDKTKAVVQDTSESQLRRLSFLTFWLRSPAFLCALLTSEFRKRQRVSFVCVNTPRWCAYLCVLFICLTMLLLWCLCVCLFNGFLFWFFFFFGGGVSKQFLFHFPCLSSRWSLLVVPL